MMNDRIIAAIQKLNAAEEPRIADWRIQASRVARQEKYFVRGKAEQARFAVEERYALTVYVDSEVPAEAAGEAAAERKKYRGSATVSIQPGDEEKDIEDKVRKARFAASKSKNPWFGLPGPAAALTELPASGFDKLSPAAAMDAVQSALFAPEAAPAPETGKNAKSAAAEKNVAPRPRINSLEIFLGRKENSFVNSAGQAYKNSDWQGYSEFIVEADSPSGPVELFDDIDFSGPDSPRLREATASRLSQVSDRASALPMPALKEIPVILSGKEAEAFFSWFFANANVAAVFTKTSSFSLGAKVQETTEGMPAAEPFDLWAEAVIPGLAASRVFDDDGFPLRRCPVIEAGVLTALVGSVRYADWLGLPRKGNFPLFSVSPGKTRLEELRAEPHLEPVMFSDFQLNPVSGDFGAEIRLAYWFDGTERRAVTGGSLSGSVSLLRSTMRRSAERGVFSHSLCPRAIRLEGLSITGA